MCHVPQPLGHTMDSQEAAQEDFTLGTNQNHHFIFKNKVTLTGIPVT